MKKKSNYFFCFLYKAHNLQFNSIYYIYFIAFYTRLIHTSSIAYYRFMINNILYVELNVLSNNIQIHNNT
jgi:hypothetical protein